MVEQVVTGWPTMPPIIYQSIPIVKTYLDNAVFLAMDVYRPSGSLPDTFRHGYNPNLQPIF